MGPSGKIAQKFFFDNPSLGIDFRKNVIILNKTPIHSPRTADLRQLARMEPSLEKILRESQIFMADILLEFQKALGVQIWITGYSEMKKGGIFEAYTERLKEICKINEDFYEKLFIYRHFSMNQFTIDLKKQSLPKNSLKKNLNLIGCAYKKRILDY